MRERVPRVEKAGVALLEDHQLVCNKRGRDGTGKANLVNRAGHQVWGALYTLWPEDLEILDGFESGYERIETWVLRRDERVEAVTYRSARLIEEPVPLASYRALILAGAREHGLPVDYLTTLEALPFRADPRRPPDR